MCDSCGCGRSSSSRRRGRGGVSGSGDTKYTVVINNSEVNPTTIIIQGGLRGLVLLAWNYTVEDETVDLYLDGVSAPILLENLSAWAFRGSILAYSRSESAPQAYGWTCEGVVRRQDEAADTAVYGISVSALGGDLAAPADPVFSADTVNGALKITVEGLVGETIDWLARLDIALIGQERQRSWFLLLETGDLVLSESGDAVLLEAAP
jgi:hypothetical protein